MTINETLRIAGLAGAVCALSPAALAQSRSISTTNQDDCTRHIVVEDGTNRVELKSDDCEAATITLNGEVVATLDLEGEWEKYQVESGGDVVATFWNVGPDPGRIVATTGDASPVGMEIDGGWTTQWSGPAARALTRVGEGDGSFWFSSGEPRRVMIGVTLGGPDADSAEALEAQGIDPEKVTVIQRVYETGPAARAGIESGDIIVRVNGFEEGDPGTIRKALEGKEPEQTLDMVALRDGDEMTFTIELAPYDERMFVPSIPGFPREAPDFEVDMAELSEKVARVSQEMAELGLRLENATAKERAELRKEIQELGAKLAEASREMAQKRGWEIDVNEFLPRFRGDAPRVLRQGENGQLELFVTPAPAPSPPTPLGETIGRDEFERLERDVDRRFGGLDQRLERIERMLERLERQMDRS